jgi:acetyl-CoA carboxylase biotin carboxyl carrier protein
MTIDEIRELINLVSETGVAEIEVQRGENRVRIRRGVEAVDVVAPVHRSVAPMPAVLSPAPPKSGEASAAKEAADSNEMLVKAPIVGTFYDAASPGTPPFVRIGESVQPGKVLCIIESMKLMNEIEAEMAGVVVSKLVANGQPVEYGEALFAIRPL